MKNLFILILLVGCADISVQTPSSRFINPEAKGELLAGDVSASYVGSSEAVVNTTGITAGQKITNPIELERKGALGFNGTLGLHKKIDFFVISPDVSPTLYGAKYQILGQPEAEATKGNHSLAVTLAYGQEKSTTTDFLNLLNSAEFKTKVLDTSLIYGYRLLDSTLLYSGVSYSDYEFIGSIVAGPQTGAYFDYQTAAIGAHLGLMAHGDLVFVKLEASLQQTDWTYSKKQTIGFVGLQLGLLWWGTVE